MPRSTDKMSKILPTDIIPRIIKIETDIKECNSSIEKFSKLIEILWKERQDKSDIEEACQFNSDLINSIKPTVDKLEKTYNNLDRELINIKRNVVTLDNKSRRKNIMINNIPTKHSENKEQLAERAEKIIKKINPACQITNFHQISNSDPLTSTNKFSVLATLDSENIRNSVLRNSFKLKDDFPGIFISKELCPKTLSKRKMKMPEYHQAKKTYKSVYFRGSTLIKIGKINPHTVHHQKEKNYTVSKSLNTPITTASTINKCNRNRQQPSVRPKQHIPTKTTQEKTVKPDPPSTSCYNTVDFQLNAPEHKWPRLGTKTSKITLTPQSPSHAINIKDRSKACRPPPPANRPLSQNSNRPPPNFNRPLPPLKILRPSASNDDHQSSAKALSSQLERIHPTPSLYPLTAPASNIRNTKTDHRPPSTQNEPSSLGLREDVKLKQRTPFLKIPPDPPPFFSLPLRPRSTLSTCRDPVPSTLQPSSPISTATL